MAEPRKPDDLASLLAELSQVLDLASRSAVDQQKGCCDLAASLNALSSTRQTAAPETLEAARQFSEQLTVTADQADEARQQVDVSIAALDRVKSKSIGRLSEKPAALAQALANLNGTFDKHLSELDSSLQQMERCAADRRAALFQQLSALDHVRGALITEAGQCKDVFEEVERDFGQQAMLVQDQRKLEQKHDAQRASTLGFRALQQADFAVAQANFRTAWQLQPAPSTFSNLVIALALSDRDVEARQMLDKHVPSEADPAHTRLLDAWTAWKAGDSSTALAKAEAALERAPEDHALRELASCAAWTLGFETRALEHLSKLGHPVVPP